MDEQTVALDDHQRPAREPVQQLVAIGRLEDRRERVLPVRLRVAGGDRQQMEIVVAEHGRRAASPSAFTSRSTASDSGPRLTRSPTSHSRSSRAREADELEQLAELRVAALDVADRVEAHEDRSASLRMRRRTARIRADSSIRPRVPFASPDVVSAQSRAARGGALSRRSAARAGGRRQRQDARHHREDRAPDRARPRPGADRRDHVHEQGGARDARARRRELLRRRGEARPRRRRHDLHVPRARPQDHPRRRRRAGPEAGLLDPRSRRHRADRRRARADDRPRARARRAVADQRAGRTRWCRRPRRRRPRRPTTRRPRPGPTGATTTRCAPTRPSISTT